MIGKLAGTCLLAFAHIPVGFAQSMITIRLNGEHIYSGDRDVIEVFDLNCNVARQPTTLQGNQTALLQICSNDTGHGNIRYRVNNGSWVNDSHLSDGDDVSP